MNVFLTGATGFIGRAIAKKLVDENVHVFGLVRSYDPTLPSEVEQVICPEVTTTVSELINSGQVARVSELFPRSKTYGDSLKSALETSDVIIHTAAIATSSLKSHNDLKKVNVDLTILLAELAAQLGVKRLVFLSSVKVNGEVTKKENECIEKRESEFREDDTPCPVDLYAKTKYLAEKGLKRIAQKTSLEIVVLRVPLVYGYGVKGNFRKLLNLVKSKRIIPLGNIHNRRAMIGIRNLVSAIMCCMTHPRAANELFLVSDMEEVSTSALIKKISEVQSKKVFLIPVPVFITCKVLTLLGKETIAERLFLSLRVDSTKIQRLLGWTPVYTMSEELEFQHKNELKYEEI